MFAGYVGDQGASVSSVSTADLTGETSRETGGDLSYEPHIAALDSETDENNIDHLVSTQRGSDIARAIFSFHLIACVFRRLWR